jgi:spore maturation protein CgeB
MTKRPGPVVQFCRELTQRAFPDRWSAQEAWTLATAREQQPDLILCLTTVLRQEVLHEIRAACPARLVAWWGDAPANMSRMGLLAKGWDVIFLKDAAAVAKFRAVGLEAELLHEAMNPAWHERRFERIGEDIVVAGNYYGYRQFLVERLLEAGAPMALYGPRPPKWAGEDIKQAHRGQYVTRSEKSRVFGEGLACLNSTALAEGDSLNCRAFEIAGACGLQLIEDKPAVAGCFEPGREVLVYRSIDDIMEALARARREPGWALGVREAGHARAKAQHTYAHRLDRILERTGLAA